MKDSRGNLRSITEGNRVDAENLICILLEISRISKQFALQLKASMQGDGAGDEGRLRR